MAGHSDTMVTATMEFAGGDASVPVQCVSPDVASATLTLDAHGMTVVRGCDTLAAWFAEWVPPGTAPQDVELTPTSPAAVGLAAVVAATVAGLAAHGIPAGVTHWQLGNVIARTGPSDDSGRYATTVHRDLDAVAVDNFRARGAAYWVNAWVPLAEVRSYPLALLQPHTCEPRRDAAPFKGLPGDTTGLRAHDDHAWVTFPGLRRGDVLLFRSDTVFHASFMLPEHVVGHDGATVDDAAAAAAAPSPPPPRCSVDLRLVGYTAVDDDALRSGVWLPVGA